MRNLLLIPAIGCAFCSAMAEGPAADAVIEKIPTVIKKIMPGKTPDTRSDVNYSWRPRQIEKYNFQDNDWALTQTERYVWFAPEKPEEVVTAVASGGESKDVYSYNELECPVERKQYSLNGEKWQLKETESWKYDAVSPTFVIEDCTTALDADGNQSIIEGYKNTIERNADGNVVSQLSSEYSDGEYEPVFKSEIIYGNDNKATSINLYEYTGDDTQESWEKVFAIKEITWKSTDGQFLFGDSEEGLLSLMSGSNRISKATIEIYQDGEQMIEVPLTATYTDTSMTAKGTTTIQGVAANIRFDYNMLEYGGFRSNIEISVNMFIISYKQNITTTRECNEWGMVTLNEATQSDGSETTIEYRDIYDVTLGDDGYPAYGIMSKYDEATGKMIQTEKNVYSDYGETSVEELPVTSEECDRYFNLQGIELTQPTAPGIYIRRHNGKASKIVIP